MLHLTALCGLTLSPSLGCGSGYFCILSSLSCLPAGVFSQGNSSSGSSMQEVDREGNPKLKEAVQAAWGCFWKLLSQTAYWAQSSRGRSAFSVESLVPFLSERELEKQRESTASDILQKKQEAEAAVSVHCRVQAAPRAASSPPFSTWDCGGNSFTVQC